MNSSQHVQFYVIGILDILGQRRTLGSVPDIQLPSLEELANAATSLNETVGAVQRLRSFSARISRTTRRSRALLPPIS